MWVSVLVLAILLRAWVIEAAVAFDNATSVPPQVVAEQTFFHTATGADRLAILCVGHQQDPGTTVDIHRYGGVDMAPVGSLAEDSRALYMYQLVAPATGSQPIEVVWSQFVVNAVVGVATFTGVHQTTPLGPFAGNSADDSGPATVIVSSATGELVVDCVYTNDDMDITAVSPQAVLWEQDLGGGVPGGSSSKPGAAPTVTMSWTLSTGTIWRIGAASIKPVAVAPVVRRRGGPLWFP